MSESIGLCSKDLFENNYTKSTCPQNINMMLEGMSALCACDLQQSQNFDWKLESCPVCHFVRSKWQTICQTKWCQTRKLLTTQIWSLRKLHACRETPMWDLSTCVPGGVTHSGHASTLDPRLPPHLWARFGQVADRNMENHSLLAVSHVPPQKGEEWGLVRAIGGTKWDHSVHDACVRHGGPLRLHKWTYATYLYTPTKNYHFDV
mmetsp:Transcript_22749/g.40943  ORF Transcript_22749/g.40943 Transcript_22749/m.40943 type:complete len:205 (+) Transcript_22749:518-1132(+)